MANVIKIKRGSGTPTTAHLPNDGELGYDKTNNLLYIRNGATVQPIGETASSILTKIKTVDGASSGLDADLLDGKHASAFALTDHDQAWSTITSRPADNQFPNTAQAIGGSQNLNDYTTPGFYYQSANANAASGSNYPIAEAGTLIVTKDAGTTQMYYHYNGSGIYYRTFYSSTWTAWQNLLTPTWANVLSKPAQATRWPAWSEVTSKPSTFAPSTHTHEGTTTTGAQTTHTTAYGTIQLGPMNTSANHIYATLDKPFYLNKDLQVASGKQVWHAGNSFGSNATNGYIKFQNGLKLNWVQVTIPANTRGAWFNWASAFTTAVYASWASSKYYDMQAGVDSVSIGGGYVSAGACNNQGTVGIAITWTAYAIGV